MIIDDAVIIFRTYENNFVSNKFFVTKFKA